MKLTILSKPSGEIYSAMYGEYDDQPDSLVIDFDENIELLFNEYMVFEGQLLHIGPRPSLFHYPDIATRGWVGAPILARDSRKVEIEQERARRNFLPILADGVRLDADATAQKNLSDKLQEVRESIRLGLVMPPSLMVWKDADNHIHVFTNIQAYHDWLSIFTIAISQRGTMLYAAAWQHKAAIATLEDIDAILGYDMTQGWPT